MNYILYSVYNVANKGTMQIAAQLPKILHTCITMYLDLHTFVSTYLYAIGVYSLYPYRSGRIPCFMDLLNIDLNKKLKSPAMQMQTLSFILHGNASVVNTTELSAPIIWLTLRQRDARIRIGAICLET